MRKNWLSVIVLAVFLLAFPGITAKAVTVNELTQFALKFQGYPYKFASKDPKTGFDCSGLVTYVFSQFGVKLPHSSEAQFQVGTPVAEKDLLPGDLVFFENTYKAGISHVGIYLGNNQFISAENEERGVQIAKLKTHSYWEPRYAGARRVINGTSQGGEKQPVVQPKLPVAQPKPTVVQPTPSAPKPPATVVSFTDLPRVHPAFEAIMELHKLGIVNGYIGSQFKPDVLVTRGQAAAMINRDMGLVATKNVTFSDVPSTHSFAPHIAAMNEAGILKGFDNGEFRMNEELTRMQLAVIIDRAFKLQAKTASTVRISALYKDVPQNYWAASAIYSLKATDKTGIFQTNIYNMNKQVSRAEFSAALYSAR